MKQGRADYYEGGDWNAVCYWCARKRKASTMKRHWQGFYVCPEHWEPRHSQDFVRGIQDVVTPPWTQPMPADLLVLVCDLLGQVGLPGYGVADCMVVEKALPPGAF
jgi:hypothetical protein